MGRMTTPLFSTYRGGENRVTSSIMAVFERIDLALVRDILAGAAGAGDELRAVRNWQALFDSAGTVTSNRAQPHEG
jgi:hypothetical protein